jgi:hypothetical protein
MYRILTVDVHGNVVHKTGQMSYDFALMMYSRVNVWNELYPNCRFFLQSA